jgi:hypothetical protein
MGQMKKVNSSTNCREKAGQKHQAHKNPAVESEGSANAAVR